MAMQLMGRPESTSRRWGLTASAHHTAIEHRIDPPQAGVNFSFTPGLDSIADLSLATGGYREEAWHNRTFSFFD